MLAAALSRENIPEDQRKDFFFYADEFQNFATEEFTSILSEARKYRLNLTLALNILDNYQRISRMLCLVMLALYLLQDVVLRTRSS
jgi:hypothetical protein